MDMGPAYYREGEGVDARIGPLILAPCPDHSCGPMEATIMEDKEKRLTEWILDGWPRDAGGNPEEIRVFVLSPEDVVYTILDRFSDREIEAILAMNPKRIVHCVSKILEEGLADWCNLVEDVIYCEIPNRPISSSEPTGQ